VQQREDELKGTIKKNCLLCNGRAGLKHVANPEKEKVLSDLDELAKNYDEKFNTLRREDAEGEEIRTANENRRFVLDTAEVCMGCERDVDRARRAIVDLK